MIFAFINLGLNPIDNKYSNRFTFKYHICILGGAVEAMHILFIQMGIWGPEFGKTRFYNLVHRGFSSKYSHEGKQTATTRSFDRSVIFHTPIKSRQKCSLKLILVEKSSLVHDI